MKLRKNDQVLIISGKDRGKRGKIIEVLPKEGRVVVEGVNLRKKHVKPKRTGEKGQIILKSAPVDVSTAKLICKKCSKSVRVGYKITKEGKIRVCKKCGEAT